MRPIHSSILVLALAFGGGWRTVDAQPMGARIDGLLGTGAGDEFAYSADVPDELGLSIFHRYDDTYSARSDDGVAHDVSGSRTMLRVAAPVTVGGRAFGWNVEFARDHSALRWTDPHADVALSFDDGKGVMLRVGAEMEGERLSGRGWASVQRTSQAIRSQVIDFPASNSDALANALFFDLVEPTFGDAHSIHLSDLLVAGGMALSKAVNDRYAFTLGAKARASHAETQVRYRNTGSEALRGDRTIHTTARSHTVGLESGVRRLLSPSTWIAAEGAAWISLSKATSVPEAVPTSDGRPLDITDLGRFDLIGGSAGLSLRARHTGRGGAWVEGSVSAGRSGWSGEGAAATPVLGYVVGSALPISHRFEGRASAHATAYRVRLAGSNSSDRRLRFFGALSATRARVPLDFDGHAALAHGLSDASTHRTVHLRLTALRLTLRPAYRAGRSEVRYAFDQSVPLLTTDTAASPSDGSLEVRGGATHTITYLYRFSQ